MSDQWDGARDTAQQAVTACVNGDRDTAADLLAGHPDPLSLALVLADLCAFTNHQWAEYAGEHPAAGWRSILHGLEAWRVLGRSTS